MVVISNRKQTHKPSPLLSGLQVNMPPRCLEQPALRQGWLVLRVGCISLKDTNFQVTLLLLGYCFSR